MQATLQTLFQAKSSPLVHEADGHGFSVGTQVRHPRYGRGVVVEASEGSSRATVTVLFEAGDREETFVAAHCPLQPVGNVRPK
jgi:hypothetical protein